MCVLSDVTIKEMCHSKRIAIEPFDVTLVQPCSVDLRLGDNILIPFCVDGEVRYREEYFCDDATGIWLARGNFVLVGTYERIELPNDIAARLEGKSSLGRLGILVHSTAGYVDPGWKGNLTLELTNVGPADFLLRPRMKICQISFLKLTTSVERPYGSHGLGSKYQNSSGPVGSRMERL